MKDNTQIELEATSPVTRFAGLVMNNLCADEKNLYEHIGGNKEHEGEYILVGKIVDECRLFLFCQCFRDPNRECDEGCEEEDCEVCNEKCPNLVSEDELARREGDSLDDAFCEECEAKRKIHEEKDELYDEIANLLREGDWDVDVLKTIRAELLEHASLS